MPPVKSTKADKAYKLLKQRIQAGEFSPGDRLTESKVAKLLGLGRLPVRESLLRLQAEGILRGKGAYGGRYVDFIEDLKPEEVLQRYEVREVIEGLAARLAAKNMNGWDIEKLREYVQAIDNSYKPNNREARAKGVRSYHEYLLSRCGNPLLGQIWESCRLMPASTHSTAFESKILAHIPDEQKHRKRLMGIVRAIAAHDPEEAERNTRENVREITEAIRRTLEEIQEGVRLFEANR